MRSSGEKKTKEQNTWIFWDIWPERTHQKGFDSILGKKEACTTTAERKRYGKLFWPRKKLSRPVADAKTLEELAKPSLQPKSLLRALSLSWKKSSLPEQGGVWSLFPSKSSPCNLKFPPRRSSIPVGWSVGWQANGPVSQRCNWSVGWSKGRVNQSVRQWANRSAIASRRLECTFHFEDCQYDDLHFEPRMLCVLKPPPKVKPQIVLAKAF